MIDTIVGDVQQKVTFDINSENAGILVDLINSELQEKSFAKVTDISGEYSAVAMPKEESVGIEYKVVLRPTMRGHFVEDSATLDSQWRGFSISGEIPMETEYGFYDINSPKSIFDATLPKTSEYLSDSNAMKILDMKLIDASGISELSLSKWESMFDPTAQMVETKRYGFSGNVITNYSMGICTVYLGLCQDRDMQEEFAIDGERYLIQSIESQDDATIVIEGYVNEEHLGKVEMFTIQSNAPPGGNENDMQVLIMYVMAGIGAAIAAGFFVWSSKKTKRASAVQTGIDPQRLACSTNRRSCRKLPNKSRYSMSCRYSN